jgi:tRNA (cmo5U34)-methyltransferase
MESFSFDNVADSFNEHLTGQLPWYDNFMDSFLPEFASFFIRKNSIVYDIGASTGNVEKRLENILLSRNIDFRPVEYNRAMAKNYQGQHWKLIVADFTEIVFSNFSFLTSILSLSFVHPYRRFGVLKSIKESCEFGGSFLILEKFNNRSGYIGTVFNRITWSNKLKAKEKLENIVNKELSLSGVQYPLDESEVADMDLIWQYGDFRAYIYRKNI